MDHVDNNSSLTIIPKCEFGFSDYGLRARTKTQGDPLGPLLFCSMTRNLSQSKELPLNSWYLEDATLSGTVEIVIEDLLCVQRVRMKTRLELSKGKCEVFVYGDDRESRAATTALLLQIVRFAVSHIGGV
ncbi:hypothetical protein BV898_05224 [Hypsibius exemplaris]|uniref:Reverse transcriptase domain-containing protein n=1 Tax=Hypsibius exemplaris TaxID=2072580 RepID=A0A1W0X0R1_HYPEX|nr:hypothetical protein BV898_05224 [Hypsibius exemplaris]